MKQLLLILILLIGANSLLGMGTPEKTDSDIDFSKLSPITLPQVYRFFVENMDPDVARYIFSQQPVLNIINQNIDILDATDKRLKAQSLREYIGRILNDYGYCYTLELLKRNLTRRKLSICDIKNSEDKGTVLHESFNVRTTQLFLQAAGKDTWLLLSAQDINGCTALHSAVAKHYNIVNLLLTAAGDHVQDLMDIRDNMGRTVLDINISKPKTISSKK